MKIRLILGVYLLLVGFTFFQIAENTAPTTIDDFFLPGSQPGQSGNLESPNKCDNCHGGYDNAVEPAFNWRGSMMSQAARDPLFFAALAIANQDAPGSGDLCLRCHTPKGWLEGRSIPTDGSALTAADRQGVTCDYCHKMVKPTPLGVNPFPLDPDYTSASYSQDQAYLTTISGNIPPASANGMYVADSDNARRGPFTDADGNHQEIYSPFHSTSDICGTCHDVSNPVFSAVVDGNGTIIDYEANSFETPAPDFNPYTMLPIERTFSEWKMSTYNTPGGVPSQAFGGNLGNVSSCQDCHMKDVTGYGCNKNPPLRTNLPLHDMTGGNTFIPKVLYSLFPNEVDTFALNAGIERARYMLQNAATMEMIVDDVNDEVSVKVTNETGHKLPSGYPEGRRIWINLKAWGANGEIYESGHYDYETAYLTQEGAKIYETKPGISPEFATALGLSAGPSFHFVLNDTIYKDNRIPPRGFTNENFEAIQSAPIGYSYNDGQFWDETFYALPFTPIAVRANLYYQTASKEYIEFLRDENTTDSWGQDLYNLWLNHGKSTPELMNQVDWGAPIIDVDNDGYIAAVDCNDDNDTVFPGAEELLDCLDNNCDGWTDVNSTSEFDLIWTGCNDDDDWNNAINWNANVSPQSAHHIIIPAAMHGPLYPSISSNITVQSITLEEGAYLYVYPGGEVNTYSLIARPGAVAEVQGTVNILK